MICRICMLEISHDDHAKGSTYDDPICIGCACVYCDGHGDDCEACEGTGFDPN